MATTPLSYPRAGPLRLVINVLSALAVAALSFGSVTTPAYSRADAPEWAGYPGQQATGRYDFIIRSVKIHNDRETLLEFGAEITLSARVWKMRKGDDCPRWAARGSCTIDLARVEFPFHAGTGDTVDLNLKLPALGAWVANQAAIGPDIGFPVYQGETYGWEVTLVDDDLVLDDVMGHLFGEMTAENNWGTPGVYTERSWFVCESDADEGLPPYGFCARPEGYSQMSYRPNGAVPGDFSATIEYRQTPLPDFELQSVAYDPGRDALCIVVRNGGPRASEAFPILFRGRQTGSNLTWEHTVTFPALGSGALWQQCERPVIPGGSYTVTVEANPAGVIAEMDERNNIRTGAFQFRGAAAVPLQMGESQVANPGAGQSVATNDSQRPQSGVSALPTATTAATGAPDLVVTGVKVRGSEKSNSTTCDPGKNDVTISVKNQGSGAASSFVVRLKIDDDDTEEKNVSSLDAGKSTELVLDDVRLKKGERDLEVTVDATSTVRESQDGNNKFSLTVNCQDG